MGVSAIKIGLTEGYRAGTRSGTPVYKGLRADFRGVKAPSVEKSGAWILGVVYHCQWGVNPPPSTFVANNGAAISLE